MANGDDHDLLIKIDAKLELIYDTFKKHEEKDAASFAIMEKDIKAAHRRMDWLTTGGILSLVIFVATMVIKVGFGS